MSNYMTRYNTIKMWLEFHGMYRPNSDGHTISDNSTKFNHVTRHHTVKMLLEFTDQSWIDTPSATVGYELQSHDEISHQRLEFTNQILDGHIFSNHSTNFNHMTIYLTIKRWLEFSD